MDLWMLCNSLLVDRVRSSPDLRCVWTQIDAFRAIILWAGDEPTYKSKDILKCFSGVYPTSIEVSTTSETLDVVYRLAH